jgi:flavorubredoxin
MKQPAAASMMLLSKQHHQEDMMPVAEAAQVQPFFPAAPTRRVAPKLIGRDTWLIHQVQEATGAPLCVYINSLVIAGAEPIIVDTGSIANRRQWLDDVFGVVDPADVRWVFLSHDDVDHTGNLAEIMAMCPQATLVCSWAIVERFANAFEFPLQRCRWLNDGDSFDAGDRVLMAVRPPIYDSPCTRGLFDPSTGIYWAADAFAVPCPGGPAPTVADLDADFWRDGMATFAHHGLAPWLSVVDQGRYSLTVDKVEALGMTTMASAHSPLIEQRSVQDAFELARTLPTTPGHPCPNQTVLEAILAGAAA